MKSRRGFITCIPNNEFPLHVLYFWLKDNVEYFVSLGTGATFKEITKSVFRMIKLAIPPRKVAGKFEEIVRPLTEDVLNLQKRNRILCQTRDLLLPKLISGELDISELDIDIGKTA